MMNNLKYGGFVLFLTFWITTAVLAESSCVTCHTDEEMLTKNLSKMEEKKSAMQSGAG